MDRIQSINPQRITWCCADHGITPSQLASEASVPPASIQRVIDGENEGMTS